MTQRSSPIHKRILALRTPVAVAFLAAATIHHLIMETASVEWRLASEILIYGVGAAVAAWVLLGWLARSVAVAERASEEQARSAARLARRNRQIEALYTASRLLHGARSLQSVARPCSNWPCVSPKPRPARWCITAVTAAKGAANPG